MHGSHCLEWVFSSHLKILCFVWYLDHSYPLHEAFHYFTNPEWLLPPQFLENHTYCFPTHSTNNMILHTFLFSFNVHILSSLENFKIFQDLMRHSIRDVVGAQEIIIKWVNWLILHRPFFYISSFLIDTSYTVISCSFHGWFWCHFLFLCLLLSWKCCGKKIIPSPYSFSFTLFTLAPLICLCLIMLVE